MNLFPFGQLSAPFFFAMLPKLFYTFLGGSAPKLRKKLNFSFTHLGEGQIVTWFCRQKQILVNQGLARSDKEKRRKGTRCLF